MLEGIVSAASLSPGDAVLEVGPGTGALTKHLLATGALITAVEKDYALHDRLAAEYAEVPALQLVCGDVLQQNFGQLVADLQARCTAAPILRADGSSAAPKVKVVANLPYYITKDFLLQAVPHGDAVSSLLLMLQDEVAVRLTQEEPGGPDWRAMNILMRYYCTPKYLFKIDKRKYYPAPKVHGAVVRFTLRPQPQRPAVPEEKAFLSLVKRSFLQRRKLLRNALQPMASGAQVAAALAGAGLPEDARAQTLGLDDFVRLAWQLDKLGVGRCGESS